MLRPKFAEVHCVARRDVCLSVRVKLELLLLEQRPIICVGCRKNYGG